jgi:glycosyltransferase involved in cell wall biosynthesis
LQSEILKQTIDNCKGVKNIDIRGYVPEQELEALFTSCAAVILPYTITTWSSGVFSLACAFGRPVIASDLPDFRDLQREAGIILFPKENSHQLAESMELVLNDIGLRQQLGDVALSAAKLIDIFDELIDSSRGIRQLG